MLLGSICVARKPVRYFCRKKIRRLNVYTSWAILDPETTLVRWPHVRFADEVRAQTTDDARLVPLHRLLALFPQMAGLSDAANPDRRDPRHAGHARQVWSTVGIMSGRDDAVIRLMNIEQQL
jgi:hypothetical protein